MPKIKNIIIFVGIAVVFILIYIFFIKKPQAIPQTNLVSSPSSVSPTNPVASDATVLNPNTSFVQDFLSLLLSVKGIKLDDTIFSDSAFNGLRDSSIILTPDGTEGRPNPFAPLGADTVVIVSPTCILPKILDTLTNTCVNPSPICILPKVLNTSTNTCVNPPLN